MDKRTARNRRATRTRAKIRECGERRLGIHRTSRHIYAQITEPGGDRV
ncbi:MAG: 50S ribosomal protein L18, partial [Hyphomicrobium sp.]